MIIVSNPTFRLLSSITQWYPGAVFIFTAPIIIGAPPPPTSERAKALQMYGNGTFDFGGPDCISASAAATWIKQKHVVKATAEDLIIISGSSDDSAPHIIPAKKKSDTMQHIKAAIKGKGKQKAITILDSGDEQAKSADDDGGSVIDVDADLEDYQEVGNLCKCKAKNPPSVEPTKSKKGKRCVWLIKAEKK